MASTLSWAGLGIAVLLLTLGQARAAVDAMRAPAPYVILRPTAQNGRAAATRGFVHVVRSCRAGRCSVEAGGLVLLASVDAGEHVWVFHDPAGHRLAAQVGPPAPGPSPPPVLRWLGGGADRLAGVTLLAMMVLVQWIRREQATGRLARLAACRPCRVEPDGRLHFDDGAEPAIGRASPESAVPPGPATASALVPQILGATYRDPVPLPLYAVRPGRLRDAQEEASAGRADARAIQRAAALFLAVYLVAALAVALPL